MASMPASDTQRVNFLDLERKTRRASRVGVFASLLLIVITGSLLGVLTQQGTGQPNGDAAVTASADWVGLFIATALVFMLVVGLALRSTGLVRRKNALKQMMVQFAVAFVALLGFFFLGFALQSGGLFSAVQGASAQRGVSSLNAELGFSLGGTNWGLIGARGFTLTGGAYDAAVGLLFLFQASTMIVAILIPIGAMAERLRVSTAIIYALFASCFLFPIYANWVWGGGWLAQLGAVGLGAGYVDFGGSGVIHAIAGWAALAGIIVVRPRIRKFNMDETANVIAPHNMVFMMTGSLLCVVGWFGVILGTLLTQDSAVLPRIGLALVVVLLAGAGGATTAMLYAWTVERPFTVSIGTKGFPDATMAANGLLGGLIAGSAAALCVSPLSGLIIGAVGGLIVPMALTMLEERFMLDDAAGAVAVHGVCGLWGQLAVGIFADGSLTLGSHAIGGLITGNAGQLEAQVIGAIAALVWGFGGAYIFFTVLNRVVHLRVSSRLEMHNQGLDVLELGSPAYAAQPDPIHGQWPRIAEGARAYRVDASSD
jgi:ammonium transporter, Amt family